MGADALMILGLSGKSCSGKNHVGLLLSERGLTVWDLDREAQRIRQDKHDEIIRIFGTTDPKEISRMVFTDPKRLKELENIIYPTLRERILSFEGDLVINGALLYRSGFDELCTAIIYVDASFEKRLERALVRDSVTKEAFCLREKAQSDVDYRTVSYRCPVFVLDNEKDVSPSDLDKVLSALQLS